MLLPSHRVLCLLLSLLLLPGTMVMVQAHTQVDNLPTLQQGKAVAREVKGGETHPYRIELSTGQLLHLIVEPLGVDVAVALSDPSGNRLVEINNSDSITGRETFFWIAEASGAYLLQLRALGKETVTGRYEVRIEELRNATSEDKNRIAAQKAFSEAEQLRAQKTLEFRRKSLEKYMEALEQWRAAGDRAGEAYTLTLIGLVYFGLNEKQKAIENYNQALSLARAVGDRRVEADALSKIGSLYYLMGENQKTLEYCNQALPLRRAVGDRSGEAETLNVIGLVYISLGQHRKALDYYNQVLQLALSIGDRFLEGVVLNNIGQVYDELGEEQKAIDFYNRALLIRRELGNRAGESITLNNLGVVYGDIGDKQKSLEYYNQALAITKVIGDRPGEALMLTNIGTLYFSLGEKQRALDCYNQALSIARATNDRRGESNTLMGMGLVYDSFGEKQKALESFNVALSIARSINNPRGEASILNNIGLVYFSMEERQKALDYYGQALPIRRDVGDRRGEAVTLNNMGRTCFALGEKQKALEYLDQALLLRRMIGDRNGEAETLYDLARVEADRGNLQDARARVEEALNIVELLRSKVELQELRTSFFATVRDYYELYIDLLMRMHKQQPTAGYDALALQVSERSSARTLLETLNEARADIRQGVDPQLAERERSLQQQLNARADFQLRLLNGKHTKEQAEAIDKELRELTAGLEEVRAQIRKTSPRYAALTQPQPLSLKDIQQQVLDPDTILLEYALGSRRSYLWVVATDAIASYELPRREEIELLARRVYATLSAGNQRVIDEAVRQAGGKTAPSKESSPDAAAALSQMILSPVAEKLGNKRLIIVSDGALQFVPFAALPAPQAEGEKPQRHKEQKGSSLPLIVEHEIVSLPSASTMAILRRELAGRRPAQKALAILADPVFSADDERVRINPSKVEKEAGFVESQEVTRAVKEAGLTDAEVRIPRLPSTRQEAARILALAPPEGTKQALDFEASRKMAISEELGQYKTIHFATHGLLNSVHPELSGLMLSMVDEQGRPQDGFLRAHEIFNLSLPAELVVLSACQTGLGKQIRGEGLIGLTRGFMYAGAARVVVSLWNVSDKATMELMARFYGRMLSKEGMRPAAALRAAQVSMWKEKRWQSPYYWAAFQLQGEWR